jgi:hypothetical protein
MTLPCFQDRVGNTNRIRVALNPHNPRIAPKPALLANSELSCSDNDPLTCLGQRQRPFEVSEQLGVPDGNSCGRRELPLVKAFGLVEPSVSELRIDTSHDPLGDMGTVPAKSNLDEVGRWVLIKPGTGVGEETARSKTHFKGSNDSTAVQRIALCCRGRIELGETGEQLTRVRVGLELLAKRIEGRWRLQIVDDRSDIQSGTSNPHHAPTIDLCCGALNINQRDGLRRVDHVEQKVRHSPLIVERRLGRTDVHVSIHGECIEGSDTKPTPRCQLHCDG